MKIVVKKSFICMDCGHKYQLPVIESPVEVSNVKMACPKCKKETVSEDTFLGRISYLGKQFIKSYANGL